MILECGCYQDANGKVVAISYVPPCTGGHLKKRSKWNRWVTRMVSLRVWRYRIQTIKNGVKWRWQRAFRGYADVDWWNFNSHCAFLIRSACQEFINKGISYPHGLTPDEWNDTLAEIRDGFDAVIDLYDINYDPKDREKAKQLEEKYDRAMALFAEHYHSLWD